MASNEGKINYPFSSLFAKTGGETNLHLVLVPCCKSNDVSSPACEAITYTSHATVFRSSFDADRALLPFFAALQHAPGTVTLIAQAIKDVTPPPSHAERARAAPRALRRADRVRRAHRQAGAARVLERPLREAARLVSINL